MKPLHISSITKITDIISMMDFWSNPLASVTLSTTPTTITGAPITVAIPDSTQIVSVYRELRIGKIVNSSGSVNGLDGGTVANTSQVIQVSNGSFVDAINLTDAMFHTAANETRSGSLIMGNIDVSGTVSENGTYTTRWLLSKAKQNNLILYDLQLGLRTYLKVS